ncbi:MAG: hypothetical protein WC861_04085 [Candidatus Micrarchaeia archaeon]|jgi:hypothetical protein
MSKQLRKPAGAQLQAADKNKLQAEATLAAAQVLKAYTEFKGLAGGLLVAATPFFKRRMLSSSKRRFAAICSLIGTPRKRNS